MRPLFKKSLAILLSLTMIFVSGAVQIFAQEADATNLSENTVPINTSESTGSGLGTSRYSPELIAAYQQLCTYISDNQLSVSISLDMFANEYYTGHYPSLEEYLQRYYKLYPANSASNNRSSYHAWYYNTDGCTAMPDYSRYNLLSIVKPGDILYEATGGYGMDTHVAIVEGIFFDSHFGSFYISLIEVIGPLLINEDFSVGVCKGVLDDDRLDANQGIILRIPSATTTQINNAISFCRSTIGAELSVNPTKETDINSDRWNCAELIWAAYLAQGINLETSTEDNDEPGITPGELLNSAYTVPQTVTGSLGSPTISSIAITSQTQATVYWTSTGSGSTYSVYRSTNTATSGVTLLTTTSSRYYVDTGLTANKTYFYWIVANKSNTTTSRSPVRAIKTAYTYPTTIYGYAPTDTSVELSWTQVFNGVSYDVYRSTSASSNYTKIATVTNPFYSDSGLTTRTTYYYKIITVNSSGDTVSTSNYRSVTPGLMRKPKIYFIYRLEDQFGSKLVLKWTNVPGATSYNVYYSTSESGTYTLIDDASNTFLPVYLSAEETRFYRVEPVNAQGVGGEWSNSVQYIISSD